MIKTTSIGIIFPLLILLNGCGKIKVASVAGEELGYAKGILVGQGLQVKTVEKEIVGVPEGQVLNQNPLPETSLEKGELVTLTVAKSPLYIINGTFTLYESRLDRNNGVCSGIRGYSDIQAGMPVTVTDASGAIIATGSTGYGSHPQNLPYACAFDFSVEKIPKRDFYSVEVGRRGKLNYSFLELENMNWKLDLSIG